VRRKIELILGGQALDSLAAAERRHNAAAKIQAFFRRDGVQLAYWSAKLAAIRLQAWVRGMQVRRSLNAVERSHSDATTLLQSWSRGRTARASVVQMLIADLSKIENDARRRIEAVMKIQVLVRGRTGFGDHREPRDAGALAAAEAAARLAVKQAVEAVEIATAKRAAEKAEAARLSAEEAADAARIAAEEAHSAILHPKLKTDRHLVHEQSRRRQYLWGRVRSQLRYVGYVKVYAGWVAKDGNSDELRDAMDAISNLGGFAAEFTDDVMRISHRQADLAGIQHDEHVRHEAVLQIQCYWRGSQFRQNFLLAESLENFTRAGDKDSQTSTVRGAASVQPTGALELVSDEDASDNSLVLLPPEDSEVAPSSASSVPSDKQIELQSVLDLQSVFRSVLVPSLVPEPQPVPQPLLVSAAEPLSVSGPDLVSRNIDQQDVALHRSATCIQAHVRGQIRRRIVVESLADDTDLLERELALALEFSKETKRILDDVILDDVVITLEKSFGAGDMVLQGVAISAASAKSGTLELTTSLTTQTADASPLWVGHMSGSVHQPSSSDHFLLSGSDGSARRRSAGGSNTTLTNTSQPFEIAVKKMTADANIVFVQQPPEYVASITRIQAQARGRMHRRMLLDSLAVDADLLEREIVLAEQYIQ
jgi:hypothetical protein